MKKTKFAFFFVLLLPCLLFADYQIKSDDIRTKVTDFNGNLSSADNTVQKALDKIDDLEISAPLGYTPENVTNKKADLADNSDTYYPSQKAVKTAVDAKQNALVSGTTIKTINSGSLLGSGDISLQTPLTADSDYLTPTTAATTYYPLSTNPAGYLTAESDPVYAASSWYSTANSASNWNTAYGWGNHASAGYFIKSSDDSDDITEGTTHLFLTSAERTILGNTSGTNTGDQNLSGYLLATGSTTGATTQAQTFTNGVITPKIYPSADSTTAVQINKADGTTNVLNVDTTNGRVGIGTTTPSEKLTIVNESFNAVYYYNGASYTDNTVEASKFRGTPYTVLSSTSSYFYIGSSQDFSSIYFYLATPSTAGRIIIAEYWNGATWTPLTITVDTTSGLRYHGTMSFTAPVDWATTSVNSSAQYYYVRLSCSNDPGTDPTAYLTIPEASSAFKVYANANDTGSLFNVAYPSGSYYSAIAQYLGSASSGGSRISIGLNDYDGKSGDISLIASNYSGTIANNCAQLNTSGDFYLNNESENKLFRHYGKITAASAGKYVTFQVNDTDDYYNLTRQDGYILGFKINMPQITTLADSGTNSISGVNTIEHTTSGTAAAGFGASQDYYLEDAGGTSEQSNRIASLWTDATHATRTSALTFSGVTSGGALTEWGRFKSNGLGIGTTAPDKKLEINTGAATGGLRLTYNDSDGSASTYSDMLIDSGGDLTITATGGDISFDNENIATTGTINALALTAQATGFTVSGGTTSKTLTLTGDATISTTPEPALGNPASDGYVLSSTAAGVRSWVSAGSGSGVFEESSSVVRQASATAGYDEDFVFGSPQLDDDTNSAHDARIIFDKSKGFFGAGIWEGTQVDDANRGTYAHAEGAETTASGTYAHAEGNSTTASGTASHAEGSSTASGNYAHAEGSSSTASGNYAHAEGSSSTASGTYAHAEGAGTTASGTASHAGGIFSSAYLYGQSSSAAGRFSAIGDAQYSRLVLRADTTNATPEIMYINNSSSYRPIIPASTCWRFDGVVVATTKNCALSSSWTIKGVIHRDASNNTEIIWSNVTEDVDEITTDAAVTCTADDTNEALAINITGKAATNIRWVAYVELAEVAYP